MSKFSITYKWDDEIAPVFGTPNSAGMDLKSAKDMVIPAHKNGIVPTSVFITSAKEGEFAMIAGRSSMAVKGILTHGGIIDSDYRKEIGVILFNTTDTDFHVKRGDRIGQLIGMKHTKAKQTNIPCTPLVSERTGGFGSTGR